MTSRSSNTPAAPVTNPASAQGVEPITTERLAEVRKRFDGIDICDPDSLTGHVKGMLSLIDLLSASPAPSRDAAVPASGGVDREEIAKIVYAAMKWAAERAENGKPPEWVERGNSTAQTEARRFAVDIASLSPAPTSGSEAGGEISHDLSEVAWTAFRDSDKPAPYNQMRDALKAYECAKPASEPAGGGVRVKPLEWRVIYAHAGECLSATCCDRNWRVELRGAPIGPRREPWIAERKAKAQAECDVMVRAALSSAPATPSPAEEVLRVAVKAVTDATSSYLPPDGISKDELISRVLEATDNPKINAVMLGGLNGSP